MLNKISSDKAAFIILIIGFAGFIIHYVMSGEVSSVQKIAIEINIATLLIISAIKGK